MDISKLYKALVVGGAMLTVGCATTPAAPKQACSEVCKGSGMRMFCPTPGGSRMNCCWLSNPHPCCDAAMGRRR